MCPALQKGQHAQAATLDGLDFRKFNHNHAGVALRKNCVTQPEGSVTLDDSTFALHDRDVTDHLDMYVEHSALRRRSLNKHAACRPWNSRLFCTLRFAGLSRNGNFWIGEAKTRYGEGGRGSSGCAEIGRRRRDEFTAGKRSSGQRTAAAIDL